MGRSFEPKAAQRTHHRVSVAAALVTSQAHLLRHFDAPVLPTLVC